MRTVNLPGLKVLEELLSYDQRTGVFVWKANNRRAGYVNTIGYVAIKIGPKLYYAHRLAWKMVHGSDPEYTIDHIDGDRSNNSIGNLRDIPKRMQHRNEGKQKNNTSGFTGVVWDKSKRKWRAEIKVNYRNVYLGRFDNIDDAIAARKKANKKYGFHVNHGQRPAHGA